MSEECGDVVYKFQKPEVRGLINEEGVAVKAPGVGTPLIEQ